MLSGGSSMYPGLPSRLEKELKQLWLTKVLGGNPERLNVSDLFVLFYFVVILSMPFRYPFPLGNHDEFQYIIHVTCFPQLIS